MNKLFKLGRISDETMGGTGVAWSEVEGDSCTTTFSTNASGNNC